MLKQITDIDKIRSLPWLVAASACNQLFWFMVVASSIVTLFYDELGLDVSRIGVVLSIIPFTQIVGLFAGPIVPRIGYKKVLITAFGIRKATISLIILSPIVISKFGIDGGFIWIASIFVIFSILRAIGEVAWMTWSKEVIPNSIRGKFHAVNSIASTIVTIAVFFLAGFLIDRGTGIARFIYLMIFGIIMGAISVVCFSLLPGGTKELDTPRSKLPFKDMKLAFADKNFVRFIIGVGFASLGFGAMLGFVPLYLKDAIGIATGKVVWVDIGSMTGTLIFVFFWGWASDRFGSKPVMITSLAMASLLPIGWIFMPRNSDLSLYFSLGISFIAGSAFVGWLISAITIYLVTTAIPDEKRPSYMPVFYSLWGVCSGLGPLTGGWILKVCAGFNHQVAGFEFDRFSILFLYGFLLLILAIKYISILRSDGDVSAQQLVGMVVQSNPLITFNNMLRYRWAGDENKRVDAAEKLGTSRAMLSSEELLDALDDPSFNVRHEAINALSKLKPTQKIIDRLLLVLGGDQPDLALTAAWSLGKLGDQNAIIALREMLLSEYELLQARCARSLALLGDLQSAEFMLGKLQNEPDKGLCVAYASALSILGYEKGLHDTLELLEEIEQDTGRSETALAVARYIGGEQRYIRLHRKFKQDVSTTTAQTILTIIRYLKIGKSHKAYSNCRLCADEFASGNIDRGIELLIKIIELLSINDIDGKTQMILNHCKLNLQKHKSDRLEYLLLVLHLCLMHYKPETGIL